MHARLLQDACQAKTSGYHTNLQGLSTLTPHPRILLIHHLLLFALWPQGLFRNQHSFDPISEPLGWLFPVSGIFFPWYLALHRFFAHSQLLKHTPLQSKPSYSLNQFALCFSHYFGAHMQWMTLNLLLSIVKTFGVHVCLVHCLHPEWHMISTQEIPLGFIHGLEIWQNTGVNGDIKLPHPRSVFLPFHGTAS